MRERLSLICFQSSLAPDLPSTLNCALDHCSDMLAYVNSSVPFLPPEVDAAGMLPCGQAMGRVDPAILLRSRHPRPSDVTAGGEG